MANAGRILTAMMLGISLSEHERKVATAFPPLGSFKKSPDQNRRELACGHTQEEHDRLQLIADEAVLVMTDDPHIRLIETEFALQQLEADFVAIEGRPVDRPRHRDFPTYQPYPLA